jgi:peptidylprolyl isomerase
VKRLGLLIAGVVLAACPVAPAAGAPIPPGEAFALPSVKECHRGSVVVRMRELDGARWTRLTVHVDGRRVLRVTRPRPGRAFRIRKLPGTPSALAFTARTSGGRVATVTRTYHPCAPGGKPEVTVPAGDPPITLGVRDLVVGTGARARPGSDRSVTVRYVLATWSDRKAIDAAWTPFEFILGVGMVIEGFDQGVTGMRVGGRRELIVPPHLGYGEQGSGPVQPGETLVFVVDLVAVD